MKTRQSLVSNSSSSSFVLIGNIVQIKDVKLGTTATYWALGKQLKHAIDLVKVSNEKFVDFITAYSDLFEVYAANAYFPPRDKIPTVTMPHIKIEREFDHKSSDNLKRLLTNYRSDIGEEMCKVLQEKYGVILDEDTKLPS